MSFFQRLRTRSCCFARAFSRVDCSRVTMACRVGVSASVGGGREEETNRFESLGVLFCDDDTDDGRVSPTLAELEAGLRERKSQCVLGKESERRSARSPQHSQFRAASRTSPRPYLFIEERRNSAPVKGRERERETYWEDEQRRRGASTGQRGRCYQSRSSGLCPVRADGCPVSETILSPQCRQTVRGGEGEGTESDAPP